MAIKWGSAITTPTNGLRIGYDISQSPSRVTSDTSSVRLTVKVYIQTRRSAYQSSASWSLGGGTVSGSGSVAFSHSNNSTNWPSTNITKIATRTANVSPLWGVSRRVSITGSISGVSAVPGTARMSGTYTVPARPVRVPYDQTNVTTSRSSDALTVVSWTRQSPTSSNRPYASQQVDRRYIKTDGEWSGWSRRATLSGASSSYADSAASNNRYQYRVRARNASGYSSWVTSNTIQTTPRAPMSLSVTPGVAGNRLSWAVGSAYPTVTNIQRQEDGGGWTTADNVDPGVTTWTHESPNVAVTHRYAIRHASDTPVLYSEWVYSQVIQLAAPPNAPVLKTAGTHDVHAPVVLRWAHNPTDGSDQQAFQLRHREAGGSWTTTAKIASDDQEWTLPAEFYDEGIVEWQVRTWGVHVDGGPYSETGPVRLSERPQATIIVPDESLASSRLTAEWGYSHSEESPQAGWEAVLVSGNSIAESRSGPGDADRVMFKRILGNRTDWTLRVRVRSPYGLWSEWEEAPFTVTYPLPARPGVEVIWDVDRGASQVLIDNPPASEEYSVTNFVPNPRGRDTSGTVTVRENLVNNPRLVYEFRSAWGPRGADFEWGGWSGGNGAVLRAQATFGSTAGIFTSAAAGPAAEPVTVSIDMRSMDERWSGRFLLYDTVSGASAATAPFSLPVDETVRITETLLPDKAWNRVYLDFIIPSGTANPGDGAVLGYMDRAYVSTNPGEYFDGDSTPSDTDLTAEWTGTPGASSSRLVAPEPVGWSITGIAYYSEREDALALVGTSTNAEPFLSTSAPGAVVGETYTTMSHAWSEDGNPFLHDRYVTSGTPPRKLETVTSGATTRLTQEIMTGGYPTYIYRMYEIPGRTVYFRAAVVPGKYDGPYFDGHFEDYDELDDDGTKTRFRYAWEGDEDNSVSTHFIYAPATITVTDSIPHLTLENCYRVTAWSDLPSSVSTQPICMTITPDTRTTYCPQPAPGSPRVGEAFLNGGYDFEEVCAAVYDVEIGATGGKEDTILHRFSGRRFPVEYAGFGESTEVSLSFTTLPEEEYRGTIAATYDQWKALTYQPGPHMYRDWLGRRFLVSVGDLGGSRIPEDLMECSVTFTRVDENS